MLDEQPSRCDPVRRSLAALPDALLPEAPWFLILIPFQAELWFVLSASTTCQQQPQADTNHSVEVYKNAV